MVKVTIAPEPTAIDAAALPQYQRRTDARLTILVPSSSPDRNLATIPGFEALNMYESISILSSSRTLPSIPPVTSVPPDP
jgi:hypothetical protein